MDKPKNNTATSNKEKKATDNKAYDINNKQKQGDKKESSDAPDQPVADMNE